jgi:hypothetical protein
VGGSGKAEGFAQALPMAGGPAIGKLRGLLGKYTIQTSTIPKAYRP